MEPVINLTIWVALTESTVENGCLRVVPSQDRSFIGHELLVPGSSRRLDHAVPDRYVDESQVIDMEMAPGEALFFDEGLMHCSGPNQCPDTARIGFSMRLVTPEVRFKMDQWDSSPENVRLFLLRGKDRFNLNPGLYGDLENRHLAAAALRG